MLGTAIDKLRGLLLHFSLHYGVSHYHIGMRLQVLLRQLVRRLRLWIMLRLLPGCKSLLDNGQVVEILQLAGDDRA